MKDQVAVAKNDPIKLTLLLGFQGFWFIFVWFGAPIHHSPYLAKESMGQTYSGCVRILGV